MFRVRGCWRRRRHDGNRGRSQRYGRVRGGHRARGALRARDRDEAVLWLCQRVRRGTQHARVSGVSRPAGIVAGPQRADGGVRAALRGGGASAGTRAVDLRPEELLLSRHAEGLPGLAVRGPDHRRRLARGRRRAHRHRARAPRGRHRQDHPRRWWWAHPRSRPFPRRLQPRRCAAHGDREPSRHPQRRAGAPTRRSCAACSTPSASPTSRWKRGRCGSTPTCRCDRRVHQSSASRSR